MDTKLQSTKQQSHVTDEYAVTPIVKPQQLPQKTTMDLKKNKQEEIITRAPVNNKPSSVTPVTPADHRPLMNNHVYHHQLQSQYQPQQSHYQQPIYVKKEDRTVASILGNGADDDDDEIGLDELDDEYLNAADSPSPPPSDFHRHNSMTRKQANSFVLQRSMQGHQKTNPVSLSQLPPPLENCIVESDLEVLANASPAMKQLQAQQKQYHVHSHIAHPHTVAGGGHYTNRQHNNPIQIQFHAAPGGGGMMAGRVGGGMPATSPSTDNLVLAPPPQFSDYGVEEDEPGTQVSGHQQKMGPNVRIVGAVPKSTNRF